MRISATASNFVLPVLLAMLALTFSACASRPSSSVATISDAQTVVDCTFPNTKVAAPNWVCDELPPNIDIGAVGVAEKSPAGISFMRDVATADARGKLVDQFQVRVDRMVKQYIGSTGIGDAQSVDKVVESVIKTVSSNTLVGSRVLKSRTGPQGRLFVLVGLDIAATRKAVQGAVMSSMKNDGALWQQFQAQKGFDELSAEIAKQPVE